MARVKATVCKGAVSMSGITDLRTVTYMYGGKECAIHVVIKGETINSGAVSFEAEDEIVFIACVTGTAEINIKVLPTHKVFGESKEICWVMWDEGKKKLRKLMAENDGFGAANDDVITKIEENLVVYAYLCENDRTYNLINHYGCKWENGPQPVIPPLIGPYCPTRGPIAYNFAGLWEQINKLKNPSEKVVCVEGIKDPFALMDYLIYLSNNPPCFADDESTGPVEDFTAKHKETVYAGNWLKKGDVGLYSENAVYNSDSKKVTAEHRKFFEVNKIEIKKEVAYGIGKVGGKYEYIVREKKGKAEKDLKLIKIDSSKADEIGANKIIPLYKSDAADDTIAIYLVKAEKCKKDLPAPVNEIQLDHIYPVWRNDKVHGSAPKDGKDYIRGSNSYCNAQVLSARYNKVKSGKPIQYGYVIKP